LIRQICIIRVLITSSPLMYFEQNIRTQDDKSKLLLIKLLKVIWLHYETWQIWKD